MTETVIRCDHYFDNAAERIASQAAVGAGRTAGDRDTGNTYVRITNGWLPVSIGGAAKAILHDSLGNEVSTINYPLRIYQPDFGVIQPFQRSATNVGGASATRLAFPANTCDTFDISVAPSAAVATTHSGNAPLDMWLMIGLGFTSETVAYTAMNGGVVPNSPTTELAAGIQLFHIPPQGRTIHLPTASWQSYLDLCAAKSVSAAIQPLDIVIGGYARV